MSLALFHPPRPSPGSTDTTAAGAELTEPTRGFLTRLHLAAFYARGHHYQVTKRVAGVRYVFTGHVGPEGRPGYGLLGAFLAARLAGAATAIGAAASAMTEKDAGARGGIARGTRRAGSWCAAPTARRLAETETRRATQLAAKLARASVRAVSVAARRGHRDAVRARVLLGLRGELVRAEAGVPAVQGAVEAAAAGEVGEHGVAL